MRASLTSILTILLSTVALLFTGCTSTPDEAADTPPAGPSLANEMITGELATTIGLGPLVASCSEPPALSVDSVFPCSATTEQGEVIQIEGSIDPEGKLALTTTNLVSAAALPSFEREVAALLNGSVGANFTANSVDCGSVAIVLPPEFTMGCALAMPASGDVFDVTLTITDLDERRFSLLVAEEARVLDSTTTSG